MFLQESETRSVERRTTSETRIPQQYRLLEGRPGESNLLVMVYRMVPGAVVPSDAEVQRATSELVARQPGHSAACASGSFRILVS
jgi:hypothetical protein